MVQYRRHRLAGASYFFTVTLRDRSSHRLVASIDTLRQAFRSVREARPFSIEAIVVLPDHLHTIWTLPSGDDDYPGRWRALKSYFSRALHKQGVALEQNQRGEYLLWQRRYWEHTLRDELDWQRHVDYIHYNPVKHGLVQTVVAWPYSSFHRYVQRGMLPADWSGEKIRDEEGEFGE